MALPGTPGHSPGRCCFYEPERKYLFSVGIIERIEKAFSELADKGMLKQGAGWSILKNSKSIFE